jgi:hypothetical protein
MTITIRLLTLAALAAVVGSVPLASADSGVLGQIERARAAKHQRLVIGVRVDFTSSTQAAGTFAACCAFDEAGTAAVTVASFTPSGGHASFSATQTFTGSAGSLTLALRGVTGPLDAARHIARGRWTIVSGGGAYTGLHGKGTFTAVTDEETGALTGIDVGEAWSSEADGAVAGARSTR